MAGLAPAADREMMEGIDGSIRDFEQLLDEWGKGLEAGDADIYRCTRCRDTGWISDGENAYPCRCRWEQVLAGRREAAGLSAKLARCAFDNFSLDYYTLGRREDLPGSYRQLAERASKICQNFVAAYLKGLRGRGLMLIGETGSGKTHLAAAVANALIEQGAEPLFLVAPEFLDQLRGSYRREYDGLDETELVRRAYDAPVLILDDLGAHNFTEWVQNKLFTIINYRLNHELPCVITTNLQPEQLNDCIGGRTTSRLVEGCVFLRLSVERDIRKDLYQRDFS